MVKSHTRGHSIIFENNEWVYTDNKVSIESEHRPCKRCGQMPTKEGYDACLGHVEGASSACCGHGAEEPYIIKKTNDHP